MEWNGMEWNGMEWNGMEWIIHINYLTLPDVTVFVRVLKYLLSALERHLVLVVAHFDELEIFF